jgi:hypothetical protein
MTEDSSAAEEARGDDVHQPEGSDAPHRPSGPLDPENELGTGPTESLEGRGWSPPERPRAVTAYGTTPREQREGAPLDDRLAEEQPDVRPGDGDELGDLPDGEGDPLDQEAGATRAGRPAAPDSAVPGGVTARDVGPDDGIATAEAAVHRDTDVDGASYGSPGDDLPET